MTVILPCTELHPETARLADQHAHGHVRWPLDPAHDRDYAKLLAGAWRLAGDLVIIEQDIGITAEVLPRFEECRRPWCGHAYPVQGHPVLALGCTRFTDKLKLDEPDLMRAAGRQDVDGFGAGHWRRLDVAVDRELRRRGYEPHRHYPDVAHFHEY